MSIEQLQQAQRVAREVLAATPADALASPTPCAKWDVAQLIDHMVGAQNWAHGVLAGQEFDSGEGSSAGDYVAAFDAACSRLDQEVQVEGATERTVDPGFGPMPAQALIGLATTDTFTHAWDLARATGQSTDLDPQLASALLASSRASIQDAFRSPEGTIFGPEQASPEGASPADQLAAFLGRQV